MRKMRTACTSVTTPYMLRGGSFRVIRGGGWSYGPWNVRCANRDRDGPGLRNTAWASALPGLSDRFFGLFTFFLGSRGRSPWSRRKNAGRPGPGSRIARMRSQTGPGVRHKVLERGGFHPARQGKSKEEMGIARTGDQGFWQVWFWVLPLCSWGWLSRREAAAAMRAGEASSGCASGPALAGELRTAQGSTGSARRSTSG